MEEGRKDMSGLQLSAKFQGSFLFPATVHHLSQPAKKVSVLYD